jgi:hypothetical protein
MSTMPRRIARVRVNWLNRVSAVARGVSLRRERGQVFAEAAEHFQHRILVGQEDVAATSSDPRPRCG